MEVKKNDSSIPRWRGQGVDEELEIENVNLFRSVLNRPKYKKIEQSHKVKA